MLKKIQKNFNPLLFLASLGAGGLAVAGFIFIQYGGIFSGKGLAILAQVEQTPLVLFLESNMIFFGIIHLVLTILFLIGYFRWRKTEAYREYRDNPLVHSGLIAPLLSLAMTMNVGIAVVRYFIPAFSNNFQEIMAPAFVIFSLLWAATVFTSLRLLKRAFIASFDMDKIHFGWLLQPFALAMVTVTASGFAALAHNTETISYNADIAGVAAFLALVSGSFAFFLTLVKLVAVFKKHLAQDGKLEEQFMPTYLIVIPIMTLFGISIFRLGHFAEHAFHSHILFVLAKILLLALYAFELWYFAFGLSMLGRSFKRYLKKSFHVSQWGLICPFVALLALSSFVFKIFFANTFFFVILFALFIGTAVFFLYLLWRQFACLKNTEKDMCK